MKQNAYHSLPCCLANFTQYSSSSHLIQSFQLPFCEFLLAVSMYGGNLRQAWEDFNLSNSNKEEIASLSTFKILVHCKNQ